MEDSKLLTGDVADRLGVSTQRVLQLEKEGKLSKVARTPGGIRLFDRSEVEALAIQRKKLQEPEKALAAT